MARIDPIADAAPADCLASRSRGRAMLHSSPTMPQTKIRSMSASPCALRIDTWMALGELNSRVRAECHELVNCCGISDLNLQRTPRPLTFYVSRPVPCQVLTPNDASPQTAELR